VAARLRWISGFASETGARARNEDYAEISEPDARRGVVAAVADGIGGGPGGREAAETAVRKFIEGYYAAPKEASIREAGARALEYAHAEIMRAARENPELRGMGTTLSALILSGAEGLTVHVGDTRIYRLRGSSLSRLTEDHNMRAQGMPNILTRSLGTRGEAMPDCATHAISTGDRFLLCTDGVTGVLADGDIARILVAARDPAEAAQGIVAAALAAGSSDNVTALVVDATAGEAI